MAGLYIHIPLCKSRCFYCDFYSSTENNLKKLLLEGICREIDLRKDYLSGESVRTIYFGGGTPSLLSERDLMKILEKAFKELDCYPEEITLEVNPDDITSEYVRSLKRLPVNRISMGVQSFLDSDLKRINRRHSSLQAMDAVKKCQDSGFDNISIDLIYGLPEQTVELWLRNLQIALSLEVPHISAYHLTYEEGTVLYRQWTSGQISSVSEEISEQMFRILRKTLQANGLLQYEISNFAKQGMESKHNSAYWNDVPYLGVGPSAHSYDGSSRQWNISDSKVYLDALQHGETFYEKEQLNIYTRYNDFVITSLRTAKGMNLDLAERKFGKPIIDYCLKNAERFISGGLLWKEKEILKLTEDGMFLSDGIMSELLWVENDL